ncbi:MAG TPA: hypothetical protein VMW17_23180 [Candidatus Binatia bacterium]|nr:hypothetical protein [Candidatus Binatia bacterium]
MLPLSIDQRLMVRREKTEGRRRDPRWYPTNTSAAANAATRALASWIGLFGFAGVLVALGYVWVRLMVVDVGYRLSATRQLVERLEQEGRELAVEAAAADTPGRLEHEAQLRLGLQRPARGQDAVLP